MHVLQGDLLLIASSPRWQGSIEACKMPYSQLTYPPSSRGSGSLGVHPFRRAERGDLSLSARAPGQTVGAWAIGRP